MYVKEVLRKPKIINKIVLIFLHSTKISACIHSSQVHTNGVGVVAVAVREPQPLCSDV